MKVNNECVLVDAIPNSPTQTGRASVHRAGCLEQTRREAPPPVQLGTGHDHIQAGQLVKHLLGLRSGTGDCPSASQRRFRLSRFVEANLCQVTQAVNKYEEIQLMRHRLCVSLSCD